MQTLRKNAKVIYNNNKEWNETFGYEFIVYEKRRNVVKLKSIKEPRFGIVAAVPCNKVTLIK